MIKAIIIDDELHCIETLQHHLKTISDVNVVAVCQDSTKAYDLVNGLASDIIFLDIEMPGLSGFDLLKQFDTYPFKVVFTTAYDQYAIQALKINALDYLLKPITKSDIELTIKKYNAQEISNTTEQINHLHRFLNGQMQDTIALSTLEGLQFLKIDDIMYLDANNGYTNIVLHDDTKLIASKNISLIEEVFEGNPIFFRAHKSHLINLKFVKQYIRGEGGEIIMRDNKSIALSRNKKQEFLAMFKRV
jgi:two-component system, LytTR family, response regulator